MKNDELWKFLWVEKNQSFPLHTKEDDIYEWKREALAGNLAEYQIENCTNEN